MVTETEIKSLNKNPVKVGSVLLFMLRQRGKLKQIFHGSTAICTNMEMLRGFCLRSVPIVSLVVPLLGLTSSLSFEPIR